MKSSKNPLRSNFMLAAEMMFCHGAKVDFDAIPSAWPSRYCCDNINKVGEENGRPYNTSPEFFFFEKIFKKDAAPDCWGGWWPDAENGQVDEPRVLALLLCAEMLRR